MWFLYVKNNELTRETWGVESIDDIDFSVKAAI